VHDREDALVEQDPLARAVLDLAARLPLEARLDGRQRVRRRQEAGDVRFGEVERQLAPTS
jgi:hypothetical protein